MEQRRDGLAVRCRRRKRVAVPRVPAVAARAPNERWAMDFMCDILRGNRAFRALTIVDTCTRECVAIEIDVSLGGKRVVNVLERLAATRCLPKTIVVDNGPEFHSRALDACFHRGLQQPVPRRMPQPALVPHARRRARHDRALAHPLQHGATAQRPQAPHSHPVCRTDETARTHTTISLNLDLNWGYPRSSTRISSRCSIRARQTPLPSTAPPLCC